MTYIVKDECIKCKLTDCVEVCPVDCFYEGENMLAINPDECIDCGVCEPECPIGAIVSDTTDIENKDKWLLLNKKFSAIWPNINKKKDPGVKIVGYDKDKGVRSRAKKIGLCEIKSKIENAERILGWRPHTDMESLVKKVTLEIQ